VAELLYQFYNNLWECQFFLALDQVRVGLRSSYDEGKRCAETLFFDYHRQNHVNIRVVRIFNTYGPRMHPNDGRVVSNFIVQALSGQDITVFGDGDPEFLLRG
jgi:nucleoside-diphosphate-sugar epimerase